MEHHQLHRISLSIPQDPVHVHIGLVEHWDDEAYDEDVDALGRAKGNAKRGSENMEHKRKGDDFRAGNVFRKMQYVPGSKAPGRSMSDEVVMGTGREKQTPRSTTMLPKRATATWGRTVCARHEAGPEGRVSRTSNRRAPPSRKKNKQVRMKASTWLVCRPRPWAS